MPTQTTKELIFQSISSMKNIFEEMSHNEMGTLQNRMECNIKASVLLEVLRVINAIQD